MTTLTLGDLSQSYIMRQRNVALRDEITQLSEELATGQVSDTRKVLAGNNNYLTDIERRLEVLQGYNVSTSEAALFADGVQKALEVIEAFGAELSESMLISGSGALGFSATDTVAEARNALDGMIGALNAQSAGRYLFSGAATDRPALQSTDEVLDALRLAVAGAATPEDVLTAADTWFDDPAGFAATVYQGSTNALAPFTLSQTDRIGVDVTAIDPKLRETLKLAAVAAIAADSSFGFDEAEQADLFNRAGQAMLLSQDNLTSLRAEVGFTEARIDKIAARNAAEVTGTEYAKQALLGVDPYETATRLEEAQFQLQSLYSVTVRMSQLSLVNFL